MPQALPFIGLSNAAAVSWEGTEPLRLPAPRQLGQVRALARQRCLAFDLGPVRPNVGIYHCLVAMVESDHLADQVRRQGRVVAIHRVFPIIPTARTNTLTSAFALAFQQSVLRPFPTWREGSLTLGELCLPAPFALDFPVRENLSSVKDAGFVAIRADLAYLLIAAVVMVTIATALFKRTL